MEKSLTLTQINEDVLKLHEKYGDSSLVPITGVGETNSPDIMFIFMNPTAKNIASH
jgi:hypothetical protein